MSIVSASKLSRNQSISSVTSNNALNSSRVSNVFTTNWQERQTNFKVVVRVRPPVERELQSQFKNTIVVDKRERNIIVSGLF